MALRLQQLECEAHIQHVVALEAASYPADEAASETQIRFRQQHATFLGDDVLVGFVNGTLTASQELQEESMSEHDSSGTTLCIHSVVVDAAYRRRGLASTMLKQYVNHVVENQVDAFTTEPFQGNPAAVLVMPTSQFL
uniref:N-acetyltransferase domain-containing protein n=1 Tax=Globisporangium ultimum (strain ATCC 200006 / CBS 805.95 / DAOM BR144) TaxID=431595 RepID=K3X365_GLOUD